MWRRNLVAIVFILCFGLIVSGCPKKTLVKEEPTVKKAEESAAERERTAKLEAERREKEARERETKEKELAKLREEEAKGRQQEQKEFEKSLVARKTPGIEGEVFETKLLKNVHFDFDKYDIRLEDMEILKQNAAVLNRFPAVKIQIAGHCDERGTTEYNLALGERRASTGKKYLISLGVDEKRISTISYGKEKWLDPGHNEEAWARNRRDEFMVLSK